MGAIFALMLVASLVSVRFAAAAQYPVPEDGISLIGQVGRIKTNFHDTFVSLGQTHGVGYEEFVAANPEIDPWLPGDGTKVVLPTLFVLPDAPREGLVLNLAEMRLYYYPADEEPAAIHTYPISVGYIDLNTPTGTTIIRDKVRDPTWYPPKSIIAEYAARGEELASIVPPGPDNPLGRFAMQLGIPSYLIHSTNKPAGIGMRVTHGCIRMLESDIASLFDRVPRGTPVNIINQPYKMGWYGDTLFLEVHEPFEDDTRLDELGMSAIVAMYIRHTSDLPPNTDWELIEKELAAARGVPVPIAVNTPKREHREMSGWCAAKKSVKVCESELPEAEPVAANTLPGP